MRAQTVMVRRYPVYNEYSTLRFASKRRSTLFSTPRLSLKADVDCKESSQRQAADGVFADAAEVEGVVVFDDV